MPLSILDIIARRQLLALAAAGAGAVLAPEIALAGDQALLDSFAEQDSRVDGKPVFWLSRGREYIVNGGTIEPISDRYGIGAQRIIRQPDGGFKRPYVETAFSTMPGATEAAAQLTSPFTGKTYPNPVTKPLRLTLRISPGGEITQDVKLDNIGIESHYKGALSFVNNPQGPRLLNCAINVQVTRRAGKFALTEMGPYRPDASRSYNGFMPATREVIVLRAASPAITGGVAAQQIGVYPSTKFASLAELMKALSPQETEQYGPWLQNWEKLLYDPSDVVLS